MEEKREDRKGDMERRMKSESVKEKTIGRK